MPATILQFQPRRQELPERRTGVNDDGGFAFWRGVLFALAGSLVIYGGGAWLAWGWLAG